MIYSFQVITLFPDIIQASMGLGVFSQAQKSGILTLSCINPREFTSDIHKTVDDRPFGGGDGMVMLPEPLEKSISTAKQEHSRSKVLYMSPQGTPLTHLKATALSREEGLILVCGRYGGIDQRVINSFVDEEISIGDYVISGGELAACVLMDCVSRFIPGVLGHKDSAEKDSFAGGLLEHPNFTKPREYKGQIVPEVLLSGHHKKIQEWKRSMSILVTMVKRPDLIKAHISQTELRGLLVFWQQIPKDQRKTLGIEQLREKDFHG